MIFTESASENNHWRALAIDILTQKHRKKSMFLELQELLAKGNEIVGAYRRSGTHKERQILAEQYYKICAEIQAINKQIEAKKIKGLVKAAFKIARFFKLGFKKFLRNLRLFFRRIMKFLFKNMDDNSGDVVFQFTHLKNNYFTTNYFPNGSIQNFITLN